jgi:hypothetical protein
VGLVGSTFEGSEDHDGTVVAGLSSPAPLDAGLTGAQWDEMVRRTMEIGGPAGGGFEAVIGKDEWVLVLVDLGAAHAGGSGTAGVTDPRVVRGVLRYLLERGRGRRFTIAAALPPESGAAAGWDAEWGGAFGGLTYRRVLDSLTADFPDRRLELTDLGRAAAIPMAVRGRPLTGGPSYGLISVALPFQRADSIVCIAPLGTHPHLGASLGFGAYLNAADRSEYGAGLDRLPAPGSLAGFAVELFTFRPAEIVVLGGGWACEGDGRPVRHNVLVAGTRAVPVDSVGAAVMGFPPEQLEQLHLAGRKGFNSEDLEGITDYTWIRGHGIAQVRRPFARPSGWKPFTGAA